MQVIAFVFQKDEWLQSLAEIFYGLTPQVGIGQHRLFLEVEQCARLVSPDEILQQGQMIFRRFQLQAQVGVGPSPTAALLQAVCGTQDLRVIGIEHLNFFYNPFEIDDSTEKSIQDIQWYLKKLGISTIADFKNLPPQELASRFGAIGTHLHRQVVQPLEIPWPRFKPEEKIILHREFPEECALENLEPVIFWLKDFLETINLRLAARGQSLKKLELRFIQENLSFLKDTIYRIPVELALSQTSLKSLLQLVRETAERQFLKSPLQARVTALEVAVLETVPLRVLQKDLFYPKREEDQEALYHLLNRLSIKLGSHNVYHAQLKESYLPEDNFVRGNNSDTSIAEDRLPVRPLRILAQPQKLNVNFNGELMVYGERIKLNPSDTEVVWSGWWKDQPERLYFSAWTPQQKKLWIFKSQDQFFLHGVFD